MKFIFHIFHTYQYQTEKTNSPTLSNPNAIISLFIYSHAFILYFHILPMKRLFENKFIWDKRKGGKKSNYGTEGLAMVSRAGAVLECGFLSAVPPTKKEASHVLPAGHVRSEHTALLTHRSTYLSPYFLTHVTIFHANIFQSTKQYFFYISFP